MNFENLDKMTRRQIVDETGSRSELRIFDWEMLDYANEAVNEACMRGRLLVDSETTTICRIAVSAGQAVYAYDPRILSIRRISLASNGKALKKTVAWELDEKYPLWDAMTGAVDHIVTGMDREKIRLFKIPTEADTLKLTVVRLPLRELAKNEDVPEINARFHRSLILYMKHKAYNNQDSEAFDKNRADVHLQHFESEFGPKSAAISDVFAEMDFAFQPNREYF